MQSNTLLRQERGEILREARTLHAKGRLSPSDQSKFNSLMARANHLKTQIESVESGMTAGALGGTPWGALDDDPEYREALREARQGPPRREDRRETPEQRAHAKAFGSYLRFGINGMPQDQRAVLERYRSTLEARDMGSGGEGAYPGATTGFFVPVGFVYAITEALKFTGPMLDGSVTTIWETGSGQSLPYPSVDDISVTGERVAEGQQVTDVDVQIGQIIFGSWKYSSRMVKISLELANDSAFDFETFLTKMFALRLGRILNYDFTLGTGAASQQPYGVLAAASANGNAVTAIGSSVNDGTAAGGNTIGSDDLTNLIHAIDPLYRPGASFMMHDSTLKAILKVKDKFGRPILDPNLQAEAPNTFLGYKIYVNNYMPTLQTQASSPAVTVDSVLFGDLRRYLVRRVREMSVLVLRERFIDYGQLGYLAFARYDGGPLYAGTGTAFPFAVLQNVF